MKKAWIVLFILLISLSSCTAPGETSQTEESFFTGSSKYDMPIKMIRYDWSGYGVSRKTIEPCPLTEEIIDVISSMRQTGRVSLMKGLGNLDDYQGDPPVERGTLWLEIGEKIYRIDPEVTEIAVVERHLGSGLNLDSTSEIERLGDILFEAWYYHPFDYYSGSYDNRTGELTINNVYEADSTVEVNVKGFNVENDYHSENSVTVELISSIDQTVAVTLVSAASDDNLAEGDYKEIELKKSRAETFELAFGGWNDTYWITVTVDNTKLNLRIEP